MVAISSRPQTNQRQDEPRTGEVSTEDMRELTGRREGNVFGVYPPAGAGASIKTGRLSGGVRNARVRAPISPPFAEARATVSPVQPQAQDDEGRPEPGQGAAQDAHPERQADGDRAGQGGVAGGP